MQKVLLTGGNGFLGYYLLLLLQHKNYMVISTGRGEANLPESATSVVYEAMDFTDGARVKEVIEKYKPDVIIHCGAISKPDDCELNKQLAFLTNVTGTVHLLQAANTCKSFFIFLSTDFIFDGVKGMYVEEDKAAPVNYYGQTKALAEAEVRNYSYPWSIVRTVLVYGKTFSGRDNIVTSTAKALKNGKELKIFTDQIRTPTYVVDLAKGIITILDKKAEGIFHLSGSDVITPYEIAVAVANYLGVAETNIKPVVENEFHQPARRPLKTGFNISKAKEVLGYQCLSFTEGLKKTLEEPAL